MDPARAYALFDTDPAPVVSFLRWLVEDRGLPPAPRVLDLGCGVGRLLAPLGALGWDAVGMEPDGEYRAAAAARAPAIPIEVGGFEDLEARASYDLVVAVNSSFSHMLTPAARLDALRRVARALRPGGVLFLDLPNFVWILRHPREPRREQRTDGGDVVTLARRHEVDVHAATFTTHETIVRRGPDGAEERRETAHVYGIVTLPEVLHLMSLAGFHDPRTYRDYASRAPEALDGPRMLVTARTKAPWR